MINSQHPASAFAEGNRDLCFIYHIFYILHIITYTLLHIITYTLLYIFIPPPYLSKKGRGGYVFLTYQYVILQFHIYNYNLND